MIQSGRILFPAVSATSPIFEYLLSESFLGKPLLQTAEVEKQIPFAHKVSAAVYILTASGLVDY